MVSIHTEYVAVALRAHTKEGALFASITKFIRVPRRRADEDLGGAAKES
jgi:hypothetical protein